MDRKLRLLLLVVSMVLLEHLDVASTTSTAASSPISTVAATITTIKPVGTTTTKPTTKAPIACKTGTCSGDQCKNATVTAKYTSSTCSTGVCVTEETVGKGTSTYKFRCSSGTCAADKKAASTGTTISCCEKPNCNTYEAANSSATVNSSGIALCAGLILFIVKLF